MSKLLKCLNIAAMLVMSVMAQANSNHTSLSRNSDALNCDASSFSSQLDEMDLELSTSACDAHLQRKLRDYLGQGSHSTERMLGRANQYFPIFEYYLARHNMPESLKYLAVAESMLFPGAVSSARAAGLWQLMPATARSMGLRVDGTVDERLDMYRSTEAAVIMLKGLYNQFGDWHLALAAYNCGPGRVRRAIRAAGGHTNYSKVKRFLPRESQKYVAAYVAAAYTVTYYDEYGLTPADHTMEDSIASLVVYRHLNLNRLADACGLPVSTVRKMNPGYIRGFIPRNKIGYRLRVPLLSKWSAQQFVWGRNNLIALDEDPELELAGQFAADLGFAARQWFLGCKPGNLLNEPSIAQRNAEDNLNFEFFSAYQALAMN
ncbi:lytic transglycosylase domain-containing protein [Neolewinella aurantiaca]|uniref:Lytic transglycosylase domain-containing protein n=1 Tax=Neolewinella aurantiaca TaxID=2602767 RepID=A0A5C7FY15_9BACT|nr:lytic transglycosylase domain-containing protein [Neolewinella aurantiaca]TXF89920.1 lytic transglycosylase domain-containing protein [Neolewinella aurantiaca]